MMIVRTPVPSTRGVFLAAVLAMAVLVMLAPVAATAAAPAAAPGKGRAAPSPAGAPAASGRAPATTPAPPAAAAAPTSTAAAPPAAAVVPGMPSKALAPYQQVVDESIERALAWLAAEQRPDGSWVKGNDQNNLSGITSLCVMAYLAKGHTPGNGPYGQTINKGIDFVLTCQRPNGLLAKGTEGNGAMYCHGIATLMLSEVSGMVDPERQLKLDPVLGKALKAILAAQQVRKQRPDDEGGWRYQLDSTEADMSCTGWQVMALRSARNNGAGVPIEAIDKAITYILKLKNADGGFAYQMRGTSGWARTGTGVLCLELCGRHRDRAALMGAEWLMGKLPRAYGSQGGEYFSYAMYYCSQATFQVGDEYWDRWAPAMYDVLLKAQDKQGFWQHAGDGNSLYYTTAMHVLAMSVPYCQLPIYQR